MSTMPDNDLPLLPDECRLPNHLGIIMDGNGRWATARNKARSAGHQAGLGTVKEVVRECARLGIPCLSLYAFSTENWKRAADEVGFLMNLIVVYLKAEYDFYRENSIRVVHSGNIEGLPPHVQKELRQASADTAHHTGLVVNLAINYGGRDELVRGFRRLAHEMITRANGDQGLLDRLLQGLTEADVGRQLDQPDLPEIDLLVRTGGEKRISNFMLWESAYAELHFSDALWPDWTIRSLHAALADYHSRNRRFGGCP